MFRLASSLGAFSLRLYVDDVIYRKRIDVVLPSECQAHAMECLHGTSSVHRFHAFCDREQRPSVWYQSILFVEVRVYCDVSLFLFLSWAETSTSSKLNIQSTPPPNTRTCHAQWWSLSMKNVISISSSSNMAPSSSVTSAKTYRKNTFVESITKQMTLAAFQMSFCTIMTKNIRYTI